MSEEWNEQRFREQVETALVHARRVLDNDKRPVFPADVSHQYQDKYLLSDMVANLALAATVNTLSTIGSMESCFNRMIEWSRSKSVSLRFTSTERCVFLRETKRDVDSATKHVTEFSYGPKITSKTVTTITEYFWRFECTYEVVAFCGTGESPGDSIQIFQKSGKTEIKTNVENAPHSEVVVRDPVDVNITHLLQLLAPGEEPGSSTATPLFRINRELDTCHTPRRNKQVEDLLICYRDLFIWCGEVHRYFTSVLFPVEQESGLDLGAIHVRDIFVPVVPLMIDSSISPSGSSARAIEDVTSAPSGRVRRQGSHDLTATTNLPEGGLQNRGQSPEVVLGVHQVESFLNEEARSLQSCFEKMDAVFPSRTATATLITAAEGSLLITLLHIQQLCQHYKDAVDYIESLIREQLVSAIGKVVTPEDFNHYMRFHNTKLFRAEYAPRPFCHAIRRSPDHAPEGVLSIEQYCDNSIPEPIATVVSRSVASTPMKFTLNAATSVSFTGERYLHAHMMHKFESERLPMCEVIGCQAPCLTLRAEARQFSSFIILIGRISSATTFEPKYGMIVKDKDEISIPLDLETIPSAKEFKDAIASLSPEQQRFAKAFRGMQLESTLFGVCVIQIKPQLERVLKLPPDSLTKEIRLAQDLMEMFIKYQIPSDLMSYDGEDIASVKEKLDRVKGHVSALRDMIRSAEDKEIEEQKQERLYHDPFANNQSVGGTFGSSQEQRGNFSFGSKGIPLAPATFSLETAGGIEAPSGGGGLRTRRLSSRSAEPPKSVMDQVPPSPPRSAAVREEIQHLSEPSAPNRQDTGIPDTSQDSVEEAPPGVTDYTKIPHQLDSKFESMDKEGSVRPTIINVGSTWSKKFKKSLLADVTTSTLRSDKQKSEKVAAFDLLDALSKSGGLQIEDAALHVVMAATHCFDRNLMDTIVQKSVNPIEKVEHSTMIMATIVHDQPVEALVKSDQLPRLLEFSPTLSEL